MVPTTANGQPAAAAYRLGQDGFHRAYGIVVLDVTSMAITRIVVFGDPSLFAKFGLPLVHSTEPAGALEEHPNMLG
jgi:RNA polymerase sigma-70 factor (ECF subfamily)